ncbi:MAG: hypothetical protein AAFW75_13295 [Cyanobacteria bacterium J06636_16]
MNQFEPSAKVKASFPVQLDSDNFTKTLSIQEQSMISGGEIKTCKNGLKPFMGDFSTCSENQKKSEVSTSQVVNLSGSMTLEV